MQLLKDLYNRAEELKGLRLLAVTGILSLAFLIVGILIGYLNNMILNQNEPTGTESTPSLIQDVSVSYEGRVVYTNPEYYPGEGISYVLEDSSGKNIIALKSDDDKLSIAEGLYVTARGREMVTKSGTPYLLVKEIIINAAD